jgi:hypothetical protein
MTKINITKPITVSVKIRVSHKKLNLQRACTRASGILSELMMQWDGRAIAHAQRGGGETAHAQSQKQ